jgi:hypothetical protein
VQQVVVAARACPNEEAGVGFATTWAAAVAVLRVDLQVVPVVAWLPAAGAGACLEELATLPRQPQGNTHLQRWDAVS